MNIDSYCSRLSESSVAIFLFHGVIKTNPFIVRNYNRKHIFEQEFYNLLTQLTEAGTAISLDDLVNYQFNEQELPKKSFIITFDDGFENNYSVAAPILHDLNVPATFYITSSFVDLNLMSWIDQIDYALEHTAVSELHLSFLPNFVNVRSVDERKNFLRLVRDIAKGNKEFFLEKEKYIHEIFDVCKVRKAVSSDSPLDKKMNWKQVKEMDANPLFTVGGHTHTHPIMSYLDGNTLAWEIDTNLAYLRCAGIKDIVHFSYPEGLAHCYTDQVIAALKKRNILCSPSAIDGVNGRDDNLFHLKRVTVI